MSKKRQADEIKAFLKAVDEMTEIDRQYLLGFAKGVALSHKMAANLKSSESQDEAS